MKSFWVSLKRRWIVATLFGVGAYIFGAVSDGYWQAIGSNLYTSKDESVSTRELLNVSGCTEIGSAKVLVYSETDSGIRSGFSTAEYRINNNAAVKVVSNYKEKLSNVVISVKASGKSRTKDLVLNSHIHTSFFDVNRSDLITSTKNGITTIELPAFHSDDSIIIHKRLSRPADLLVEIVSDQGRGDWRFSRGRCDDIPNEREIQGAVKNIFMSPQCDNKFGDKNTVYTDCPMYIGDEAQAIVDEIQIDYPDSHRIEFYSNKIRRHDINNSPMPIPNAKIPK